MPILPFDARNQLTTAEIEWVSNAAGLTYAKGTILVADAVGTLNALAVGTDTHTLTADSGETLGIKWSSGGAGDVVGPGSATDNAIARYNLTTGKIIQDSSVIIDDSNNVSGVVSMILDAISAPAHSAGTLFYDTDDDELSFYNAESAVKLNIGSEVWVKVRNNSGGDISDFTPVYQTGAVGNRATIAKAKADSINTSNVIGITTHSIENNSNGFITVLGTINGVDTDGSPYSESWSDGDEIFLSATTAGDLTNVAPTGNNIVVCLGSVLVATNSGSFHTTINGSDVRGTSSSTDNQIVRFDGTSGKRIQVSAPTINDTGEINMGSQKIISLLDPTNSQDAATKEYVDTAVEGATFDFFLNNTASDIGGIYFVMDADATGEGESTFTTAGLGSGSDQALTNWATLSTEPQFTELSAGVYDFHFHAEVTVGTRDVVMYAELYKRAAGGAETLLATSEETDLITSKASFDVHLSLSTDTTLLSDDRLVVKTYANVGASGSNVTVVLYAEGNSASRLEIKTTSSATDSRYLVKTGLLGGQIAIGGTASGEDLTLQSTSHATKGSVFFGAAQTSAYDETNDRFGIGTIDPHTSLHIKDSGAAKIKLEETGESRNDIGGYSGQTATDQEILCIKAYWGSQVGKIAFITGDDTGNKDDGYILISVAQGGVMAEAMRVEQDTNVLFTGDIGITGTRVTKGWFTDLQVTNAIAGSITGNAATVSTITGLAPDTATTQATQAAITTCANLVTVGALASGSIASGFGTINIGTSNAVSCGSVELGHASDTTLARSAGGVLSVEGVVIPSISSTNTLTNKRVTPRVTTEASSATPTINTDNSDAHSITALAAAITSMTTNLSGTPTNFQKLIIRILDNGTARAITWGASFQDSGVALPTTTTISKILTVGFIYDTATSKWGCVAVADET